MMSAFSQAAAQPVYDQLETDPQTAALITQIRALKAGITAPAEATALWAFGRRPRQRHREFQKERIRHWVVGRMRCVWVSTTPAR